MAPCRMKTNKLIKGIIFTFSLLLPLSFNIQAQANNSKGQIRTLTIEQAEALKYHKSSAKRSTAKKSKAQKKSSKSRKATASNKKTAHSSTKKSTKKILKHKLKLV